MTEAAHLSEFMVAAGEGEAQSRNRSLCETVRVFGDRNGNSN